jgi:imidazoleglycerol-phosphate dehydratase/histidinol-phosphatase
MKKTLFIDRDGTIIKEPADEQVDSFEKLSFLPGVITALAEITKQTDFDLVMVTNQDGLGTPSFPEETFWPVHNLMLDILGSEGIAFSNIFIDKSFPSDKLPTRKPGTALLTQYLAEGVDLKNSFVIGDRVTDIILAQNLGCRSIFIGEEKKDGAELCTADWNEIAGFLTSLPRRSTVKRITKETSVTVDINLNGTGKSAVSTGIGFFDHMLEQIPRHSGTDLTVKVTGDLGVDGHHTIEDTALTLGEAIRKALGGKKGIERYGFVLPMDDALATVALDLGGRPFLDFSAEFQGEKIGKLPTDMIEHFFRSLCDTGGMNISLKAEGRNDHHKCEALFKGFARALGQAIRKGNKTGIPSSKGVL